MPTEMSVQEVQPTFSQFSSASSCSESGLGQGPFRRFPLTLPLSIKRGLHAPYESARRVRSWQRLEIRSCCNHNSRRAWSLGAIPGAIPRPKKGRKRDGKSRAIRKNRTATRTGGWCRKASQVSSVTWLIKVSSVSRRTKRREDGELPRREIDETVQ